ncbi:MAG TPA: hypothetical protein VJI75_00475 [Candidatus Nanoarchaeia archaeon]|nr:hypothetical protein [Candidatus Nanoarchaeia archaeon]
MAIKQGIKEFILSGKLLEEKKLLIPAADNYFKALVQSADWFIQQSLGKIPDSHSERFRMLEGFNKELYLIIDGLFRYYVKSYRDTISMEELERIKDGLRKTLFITGLDKELKEDI